MKKRSLFVKIVAISLAFIMAAGLIAGVLATTVHAATSSEIQQVIDELEAEAADIDVQQAELNEQIAAAGQLELDMIEEKALIDQQATLTRQMIDTSLAKIEQYELLIAEKSAELDEAEDNEAELYVQYKDRLRAMEENGSITYWSILFKASSFSDLLDRLDMIQEIARSDQMMMEELEAASAEILAAQVALEDTQTLLEAEYAELAAQEAALLAQSADAQTLIDQYAEEGVLLQEIYDQYETQQEALLLELAENQEAYALAVAAEEAARLAAEEAARLAAEEEARRQEEQLRQEQEQQQETVQPEDTQSPDEEEGSNEMPDISLDDGEASEVTPSQPEPPAPSAPSIGFTSPLSSYVITSPYGMREHPILGYERFHYGVDMSAPEGTPIYAAASGTVSVASFDSSSGNYVMVSHSGGFATSYLHMTHYIVSVGQYVSQGQVIGYVGSTGLSTGPHLHFAMYLNGSFVNPMDYL